MFARKIVPAIPGSQSRTDDGPYLNPFARQAADLDAALRAWNVGGLVALAISDTDFIGDLDPATLAGNAANSADLAADISEDRTGIAVPLDVVRDVRAALIERGYAILCEREMAALDAAADARDAGCV